MITLFEEFDLFKNYNFNPNQDWSAWLSPDGKIHKVYQYGHIPFIKKFFPEIGSNELYGIAFEHGWVRLHYVADDIRLNGELNIAALNEKKIKKTLFKYFKDFLSIGDKDIFIQWGHSIKNNNFKLLTNNKSKVKIHDEFMLRNHPQPFDVIYVWDYVNA